MFDEDICWIASTIGMLNLNEIAVTLMMYDTVTRGRITFEELANLLCNVQPSIDNIRYLKITCDYIRLLSLQGFTQQGLQDILYRTLESLFELMDGYDAKVFN